MGFRKAVRLLNLRLLDDFLEVLLDLLVRERVLDHGLLRFKGRIELSGTLGFKLHDVEAELRANRRLTDFAGLKGGEGGAEGRHEGARNNPAEEAALGLVARVFGEFLRELAEVGALIDALNEVLRLVFRLHENVANLVFRVAVGLLVGVIGLLEVGFGNRVLLGPILCERTDEDLVARFFNRVLHVGLIGDLGLLGFLEKNGLLNEKVLDLAFKLSAGRLALSNGAIINGLLFGDRNGFAVHLEGLEFSAGGACGERGGKAENNNLLIHGCYLKIAEGCRSSATLIVQTVEKTESIVALGSLFCHPDGNANCKYHCQRQEAEKLKVNPDIGREGIGDSQINESREDEEPNPHVLQFRPSGFRHLDLALHEKTDEIFLHEVAVDENRGKKPVENRGLPFDEPLVLEIKREAAEKHDHAQADPERRFDFLAFDFEVADLQECRGNMLRQ